jgi:hypothetical protein
MRQRNAAIAGVSAALLVGAGAGFALASPGTAGAVAVRAAGTTGTTDTSTEPSGTADAADNGPERHGPLKDVLDALVADGTITQAQEDAILARLDEAIPAPRVGHEDGRRPGGRGFTRHAFGLGADVLTAAADALGVTEDELRTELRDGTTIAEVASDKGVDVQKVIDAMVAAAGDDLQQRITDFVNGDLPEPPFGPGRHDRSPDETPAPDAPTTTTG